MTAHVLEVSLDNRRLGETQLAPLVTAWRAGEAPSLRLSEKTSPSPALKRARAALHAGTTWDTRPKSDAPLADTALEFARAFPLLPVPVFTSPLYMVLSDTDTQATEYPAIVNSFAQLRFFAWAEKIIFEGSEEVGKAKRQKAKDEMRKNLFEVAKQAFVSFGKICLLPAEIANEQLQLEAFYNNLNALRILEFTLLDYLDIDTTRQTALVTPDYNWLPTTAPAPATPPTVYAEIRTDLGRMCALWSQKLGAARPAWVEWAAAYDPQRVTSQAAPVKAFLREVLSMRLFACQNREGNCTKQETAIGEFKSCARCGWFRYCSRECQTAHWRIGHKTKCGSAEVKSEIPRIIIAADTDTDENHPHAKK